MLSITYVSHFCISSLSNLDKLDCTSMSVGLPAGLCDFIIGLNSYKLFFKKVTVYHKGHSFGYPHSDLYEYILL